jgi:hypothetical protein
LTALQRGLQYLDPIPLAHGRTPEKLAILVMENRYGIFRRIEKTLRHPCRVPIGELSGNRK